MVAVTKEERDRDISNRGVMYVIEQTGIDYIDIWQGKSGQVYRTYGNEKSKQISNSLEEFFLL